MRSATNFSDAPANSTAIIALHGTMLKYGTYCSYGCVEVAEMIEDAANSPKISGIILDIDSRNGAADAIAPILSAINQLKIKANRIRQAVTCAHPPLTMLLYTVMRLLQQIPYPLNLARLES